MTSDVSPAPSSAWLVYMIRASDNSLYTGITTDVMRRWNEHCGASIGANKAGGKGAKFFRGRSPQDLSFVEPHPDRASASRREAAIKKLNKQQKEALVAQPNPICQTLRQALASDRQTEQ